MNAQRPAPHFGLDEWQRKQTQSGLKFLYEPSLCVGTVTLCPDFYLTEYALPYEHFGLNTESYLRAAELKIAR